MTLLSAILAFSLAAPAFAAKIKVVVGDKYGTPAADAVVYLVEEKPGKYEVPEAPYIMDQVNQEFVPHVLPVLVGGKVTFPNKDAIHHQIYSFSEVKKFDLPLYKGKPADPVTFETPGVVKLGCSIHDWMNGIILVLPNPVFAKTDAKGAAELEAPAGAKSVTLEVFHERLRGETGATRKTVEVAEGAKAEWKLPMKLDSRKKRPVSYNSY
ncbi:MAG: hypothetical protein HY925_09290 [Elusimicrobia bacterium]|nr:hypothetical protein [Elusimicrobiota bacterium]